MSVDRSGGPPRRAVLPSAPAPGGSPSSSPWARPGAVPTPRPSTGPIPRPRAGDAHPVTGPVPGPPGPKPGLASGGVAEKVGALGFTGPLSLTDVDVLAAARGDRLAFATLYDRYSPRLYDFCLGMLRDRDAAADAVQDTFCTAATRLHQLREPDKVRPWLYAIARHEALRRIRARTREQTVEAVPDHPSGDDGPDVLAARSALATLVADAAGGLSDRDRTVLELHYRHGLDGPELADALGVSHTNANTLVARLRTTVERSLGALLVARRARSNPGHCPALDTIIAGWDGRFTVLMRKRIARHLDGCPVCDTARRDLVSPKALLGTAPMVVPAPFWLRGHVLAHATPLLHTGAAAAGGASWWPAGRAGRLVHGIHGAHLAVGAPLVAAAVAIPVIVVATGDPVTVASSPVPAVVAAAPVASPQFALDTPTRLSTPASSTHPPRGTVYPQAPSVARPPASPAQPGRPTPAPSLTPSPSAPSTDSRTASASVPPPPAHAPETSTAPTKPGG